MRRAFFIRIALIFVGISIAMLIGEIGLRCLFSFTNDYYVWHPRLSRTFKPLPNAVPGIEGESRFLVNSEGIRGEELLPEHTYRTLTVGGSTTENTYLDQSETWQYLLQKGLNKNSSNQRVWVGNVGKSGTTTRHHLVQMRYLLERYPNIDVIILLIGVNDLCWRLVQDKDYNPYFLDQPGSEELLLSSAFSIEPIGHKATQPYHKRTAIWHMLKKIKHSFLSSGQVQDRAGESLMMWRKHRRNAAKIWQELPDLDSALNEYSRNINSIIELCRNNSVRPIFMTQPVLWKPGLSGGFEKLLYSGGIGNFMKESGKEYYSVEALATGIEMYNKTLLDVCQIQNVECIDLASLLPKDTTIFYDDFHFNESGSEKVSEVIVRYMLQHPPFNIGR